jgi:hypothetical protein
LGVEININKLSFDFFMYLDEFGNFGGRDWDDERSKHMEEFMRKRRMERNIGFALMAPPVLYMGSRLMGYEFDNEVYRVLSTSTSVISGAIGFGSLYDVFLGNLRLK